MGVVILVPWRGGDELREQSWDVVRPYLEAFGWPVITGDGEGPWSRAAAVNAAAEDAGDWDVAVIADADTIPPEGLPKAVRRAQQSGGGIRPHDHLYRLTPSGSIAVANKGVGALEPRHIQREHPGGGLLVVARDAWERLEGFPEDYVGWGHEDSAFGTMLVVKASWDRMPGTAWHLWHPEPDKRSVDYRRNRQMLGRLQQTHRRELQEASRAKGYDVGAVL